MPVPPYEALVAAVRREGEALLGAVRDDVDAPVPSCPGWDARRLLAHVGRVHRQVAGILTTRAQVPPADKPPSAGADVVGYYAESLAMVADALAATEPGADVWTWGTGGASGATWWARRVAYETLVHRADAELAAGRRPTGPTGPAVGEGAAVSGPELSADAVDEFFDVMLPRQWQRGAMAGLSGTLHLHATDLDGAGGEWLVTLTESAAGVQHVHAKGDAALRGPAHDLLLVLYNRLSADAVQAHGDEGLLARWREATAV